MEEKSNDFLEKQPVSALMRRYAVPCVISLLVDALYNIVDQLFITNDGSHQQHDSKKYGALILFLYKNVSFL